MGFSKIIFVVIAVATLLSLVGAYLYGRDASNRRLGAATARIERDSIALDSLRNELAVSSQELGRLGVLVREGDAAYQRLRNQIDVSGSRPGRPTVTVRNDTTFIERVTFVTDTAFLREADTTRARCNRLASACARTDTLSRRALLVAERQIADLKLIIEEGSSDLMGRVVAFSGGVLVGGGACYALTKGRNRAEVALFQVNW